MNATPKTRILIVDDHAVFREALGLLLAAEPDFVVAGKCGSVDEALAIVDGKPIDAVLLDLDLDGTRGAAFCALARELGFKGKVLVLTARVAEQEILRLLADGASGIFLKHTSAQSLPPAIRQIMAGQAWIDPQLVPDRQECDETRRIRNLTERERQVLMGVFEGFANKEIGARLNVSEEAVKASVQHLFSKLGVRSRVQLARKMMDYIGERVRNVQKPT